MVFAPVAVELNNEDCCSCCGGDSPEFKGCAVSAGYAQYAKVKPERRQQAPQHGSCHIDDVAHGRLGVIAFFCCYQGAGCGDERANSNT